MASQEQLRLRERMMRHARMKKAEAREAQEEHMRMMAPSQQDSAMVMTPRNNQLQQQMQPQARTMGTAYDDVPITQPSDERFFAKNPLQSVTAPSSSLTPYEFACRHGPLSDIESIMASEAPPTPAFLNHGLNFAIAAGNVDAARHLLGSGAPVLRLTPELIFRAPPDQQIALFELILGHGWMPTKLSPDRAGLLAKVVTNIPLLSWFLAHGANPNLGVNRQNEPDSASCAALEAAANHGSLEAVKMLLEAGAHIGNGTPLHSAAGVYPAGTNPRSGRVAPSQEFDAGRIPIMELLVEAGADVNQRDESRHATARYPLVYAVMAEAVERTKWLLSRGADPLLKGAFGSAAEYARRMRNDEMKTVIEEGIAAEKWMKADDRNQQKD
ncbi:ankyrin repeat-containing domain protein [Thelonectria olida]|uniref:Ankyrin repeat-containing domain protein n=1 Tax=Thelonectria olida TaxID=1576542 RepID=A0A9P9AJ60_9HYPO|nr:ankyrin repeat-containing domain protein [Thelonectria olida]